MNRRTLITGAPVGLTALALGALPARAGGPGFEVSGSVALGAYRGLVEDHLGGIQRTLHALSLTADAQSADWNAIKGPLGALAGDLSTAAAVWFALPDGSYSTVEAGKTSESLSDRAYFPDLLAGNPVVAALVVSKSTGHRSVIVAVPVLHEGRVVGALGVSARARFISAMVEAATAMPEDITFYALAADGQTAIHRDPGKMFAFPSDMGDASLKEAVEEILGAERGVVNYSFGGVAKSAFFERSALSGWRFVLARNTG